MLEANRWLSNSSLPRGHAALRCALVTDRCHRHAACLLSLYFRAWSETACKLYHPRIAVALLEYRLDEVLADVDMVHEELKRHAIASQVSLGSVPSLDDLVAIVTERFDLWFEDHAASRLEELVVIRIDSYFDVLDSFFAKGKEQVLSELRIELAATRPSTVPAAPPLMSFGI